MKITYQTGVKVSVLTHSWFAYLGNPKYETRVSNRTLERIKEAAFESEQRKKKFEFTIFGYTFKFSISYE